MVGLRKVLGLSKGKMTLMAVSLAIGIGLLTVGSLMGGNPSAGGLNGVPGEEDESGLAPGSGTDSISDSERALESRLERVLGEIDGVGQVTVTVVFKTGPEYQYAQDENTVERRIDETDSAGGERVTTETTTDEKLVMAQAAGMGGQEPVTIKETRPEIQGVLVVAEGANNWQTRADLFEAVQTVLGVPAYSVSIVPMRCER